MSYQVLARKWRPNSFAELVGQEHVVAAISNALDNDRLHHAYLFTGTRGVGKTTIARIFAKSLNCETGMSSTPCGKCSTCLEIEQGNYVDLLEIDAASRTKVEDTRELLDNVQYKPTRGEYKVYLIDEVHMLSKHSFNALLKTLEEPPPHVKFLLATTDPQKLPVTILSRCLQFNLKALSREQISHQLEHILTQESIPFEQGAIAQLSRAAQGSMRDALSLTDQAIAHGNNQVRLDVVTDMLGLMDKGQVIKLLHAVINGEQDKVFNLVDQIAELAPDYQQVLAEFLSLLHQIALTQFVPDACKLETIHAKAIYTLSKNVPPEIVQLFYQITLQGRKDLPHAADGRSGFEMTLLRMLAFKPDSQQIPPEEIGNASIQNTPFHQSEQDEQEQQQLVDEQDRLMMQAESMMPSMAEPEPPMTEPVPPVPEIDIHQAVDPGSEASSAPMPEPVEAFHNTQDSSPASSQADGRRLDALEHMLALKRKLNAPTSGEEDTSPAKKSEPETTVELSDELSAEPLQAPSAETKQSTEQQNEAPGPNATVLPTHNSQGKPAHVEAASDSSTPDDLPPWLTEPIPDAEQYIPPVRNVDSLEQLPELDAHGHLEETEAGPVDKVVPAFLDNGEKVVSSHQLDQWASTIEHMRVEALTKQLALHSSMSEADGVVHLLLNNEKQHLNTDIARGQLAEALSSAMNRHVSVQVTLGEPVNTPYSLQRAINTVRQNHANEVVEKDEVIGQLRNMFAADVVQESIKPR